MGSGSSLDAALALDDALAAEALEWRSRGLERALRPMHGRSGRTIVGATGAAIDFASNDYLGLAGDPRLARAIADAATRGVGAGASRLITGDDPEHEALELTVAQFMARPAALTFSSGWAANAGTVPTLVRRGDVIFSDALNHASLIDGCRLSRADVHVYPHCDIDALEALLAQHRPSARRALIVTDALFSMDGDVAPLPRLVECARGHDAWTYVDDAHGIGVLGSNGRGAAEMLDVLPDVDVLVGTFGKAFGCAGAFVTGSVVLREHLINHARSFVFSTAMILPLAAAARMGIELAASDAGRRRRVAINADRLRRALDAAGVPWRGDFHIVSIPIGDADRTVNVGASLADRGLIVGAIRPPTVAPGTSRLRLTVGSEHTTGQIDAVAEAIGVLLHER